MKRATSKTNTPSAERVATGSKIGDAPAPSGSMAGVNSSTPVSGSSAAPANRVPITKFSVLAVHVAWMLIGPFVLLVTLVNIVRLGTGWLTILDAVYFIVVVGMILCRWIDQRSGQATTSTGETATWADFRRYAMLLPPLAIGAWILANAIGNHMF